ncbi:T9SS type A sorting domain-containing protein [Epilithonimonas vandammei]|uniref:Secretion system C-terminal sorting domain-containing protein n=1 Tax=Epilithonimonas vandammei TaxID=2487072 RepID=A0A3G8Y1W3_9FLAO|nr:T9SS type A sorting domain-containing protein [Epilithonimonas vandammei]AZI39200.1 hypothetical protein EIB74_04160 [Epilithonimonas vandammei]
MSLFSQSVSNPDEEPEAVTQPIGSIVFRYDEAGNQIYRGTDLIIVEPAITESKSTSLKTEDPFWLGIQIYPVPVKDVLTISWNEENNDLIESISLYQHTTMAFLFQQKNYANLNRQVQIGMSSYYMGVYVLSFQLKDGRVMTRNIIKE